MKLSWSLLLCGVSVLSAGFLGCAGPESKPPRPPPGSGEASGPIATTDSDDTSGHGSQPGGTETQVEDESERPTEVTPPATDPSQDGLPDEPQQIQPTPAAVDWSTQWGTSRSENGSALALDHEGEHIYLAGVTEGTLADARAGGLDVFVTKMDPEGSPIWTRQWGTLSHEGQFGIGMAVHPTTGDVYVVGETTGTFGSPGKLGPADGFLTKLDPAGTLHWTTQFGTEAVDMASSVVVDADGFVYVVGMTWGHLDGHVHQGERDAFLAKFDASGEKLSSTQWGTRSDDSATSVALGAEGRLLVAGVTSGSFLPSQPNAGGPDCDMSECSDIFLIEFKPDLSMARVRQWGTSDHDYNPVVHVGQDGAVHVCGTTMGSFDPSPACVGATGCVGSQSSSKRRSDLFLTKFNARLAFQWTRQWGSADYDGQRDLIADAQGNVFVTGWTGGSLEPGYVANRKDAFLTYWDASGSMYWSLQWGSQESETAWSLLAHPRGGLWVSGWTVGELPGQRSAGQADIFLCKIALDEQRMPTLLP